MTSINFKDAMGHLASGISVLACKSSEGVFGITISSLKSVGVKPPTVSVCVEGQSQMINAIREAGKFGVTVLRQEQQQIAKHFSDAKVSQSDRFSQIRYELINECPIVVGGLSAMTCSVIQEVKISGNVVFYGEVTDVQSYPGEPLIYYFREWRGLAAIN